MENIVEITKKEISGLENNDVVKIWEMNYGFRCDLNGKIMDVQIDITGKKKVNINLNLMKIYYLVYGIFSWETIGIMPPKDVALGLSDGEISDRQRKIRMLNKDIAEQLYLKIQDLNNKEELSEEVKKA